MRVVAGLAQSRSATRRYLPDLGMAAAGVAVSHCRVAVCPTRARLFQPEEGIFREIVPDSTGDIPLLAVLGEVGCNPVAIGKVKPIILTLA